MFKRFRSLFRVLAFRRDFEDGMTEELRFHIEQYADDMVRSGVPAEEALRRARLEFGGLNSVKGECREARKLQLFDELGRELRYAARLLLKTPGFTATALLTIALCLGANLTIFAVIDSVLLRPLPFPDAGRLVTVFNTYPKAGVDRDGSSLTNCLRTPRARCRFQFALYLPLRHGDCGRGGGNGARTDHTSVSGIFQDFGARASDGPCLYGRRDHASNGSRCDFDRRLLAATLPC